MQAPAALRVSSSAFEHGAAIPAAHAGQGVGDNVSPQPSWEGLPEGTAQPVFVMEDPDVSPPQPLLHTLAVIDPGNGLGRGELRPGASGIRFVPAASGRRGYAGPRPVPGHGPHHYGFYLYALDRILEGDDLKDAKSPLAAAHGWSSAACGSSAVL